MYQCHGCDRHVRVGEDSCPFCRARLRSTPGPGPRLISAVVGLAFVSCGASMGCGGLAAQDGKGQSSTGKGSATATATETWGESGTDYGLPPDSDWTDSGGWSPPDMGGGNDTGTGIGTGTDGGGGSSDTGTSTGTGTTPGPQ